MKQVVPFKKDIIFKSKISEITSISLEHSLEVDEDMVSGDFIISGDYKMTEASVNKEPFSYNLPFDIALDDRYDTSNLKVEIEDFYYEIINDDILRVNIEVSLDGLEDKPFRVEEEIIDFNDDEEVNEKDEELDSITSTIEELKKELDEKNNNLYNLEKIMKEKDVEHKLELDKLNDELNSAEERNDNIEVIDMNKEDINEIPIMTAQNSESMVDTKEIKSLFSNLSEEETFSTYHVYIMREDDTIENVITKYNVTKEILSNYNDLENIKLGDKIIIPSVINND